MDGVESLRGIVQRVEQLFNQWTHHVAPQEALRGHMKTFMDSTASIVEQLEKDVAALQSSGQGEAAGSLQTALDGLKKNVEDLQKLIGNAVSVTAHSALADEVSGVKQDVSAVQSHGVDLENKVAALDERLKVVEAHPVLSSVPPADPVPAAAK